MRVFAVDAKVQVFWSPFYWLEFRNVSALLPARNLYTLDDVKELAERRGEFGARRGPGLPPGDAEKARRGKHALHGRTGLGRGQCGELPLVRLEGTQVAFHRAAARTLR